MNYDLALKLKNAGFPQKTHNECCGEILGEDGEPVIIPDLSELIEACGKEFECLYRRVARVDGTHLTSGWIAYSFVEPDHKVEFFDSPEEAVANLWLALNTKST